MNYYFGGKDKLYAEMFRRNLQMMIQGHLETIERVMAQPDVSLEELLRSIVRPTVRRVWEDERGGKIIRLLVREVLDQQIDPEYIAKDMKEKFFDRLGHAFVRLVPDLDEKKLDLMVLSFDGVILHPILFMDFYRKTMPDLTVDELVGHVVRFVAAAIRGYATPTVEGGSD